jgi:hypothetical protein
MKIILLLSLLVLTELTYATPFQGVTKSYNKEQCFLLNRFVEKSGVKYQSVDTKKEETLCDIDFNNSGLGMCPKTWSTSPGTVIYDIQKSRYNGNPNTFESEYCPKQMALKGTVAGVDKIATFKQSVNGQFNQSTSATFSQASPLYYHFSRYFNMTVDIPVAVIRTMDAKTHLRRIASKGSAIAQGRMNLAGWNVVKSAEENPSGYHPVNEFYYGEVTDGLLYGTMLKGHGERYGAEFNGNISGKGYSQQYLFFQKTPAFYALMSPKKFLDAIALGVTLSKKDPIVAKTLKSGVSAEQMMFWMQEMSEISIIDYIFNQQDRPGNIDYIWIWYYINDQGELKSKRDDSEVSRLKMESIQVPEEVKKNSRYVLIQKTQLNDNDAGGRKYTNFTKKFALLEKIRHLNGVTYRQLIRLANDFQVKGDLYNYLRDTFYLSGSYTDMIAQNTIQAAQILKGICKSGAMKFDLDSEAYLVTQKVEERQFDCENP